MAGKPTRAAQMTTIIQEPVLPGGIMNGQAWPQACASPPQAGKPQASTISGW